MAEWADAIENSLSNLGKTEFARGDNALRVQIPMLGVFATQLQ